MAIINEDFPKLKYVSANDLAGLIKYIVEIMNIKVGDTEFEIKSMDRQMLLIGDLLRTEFGKSVTVPEVKHAFKMYVSKQFPDLKVFRILDCITVGDVINAYIDHRNDSLRNYTEKKSQLKFHENVMEKPERFKILKRGVWKTYLEYLEKGYVLDNKFHIFDFLYEIGTLPKSESSPAVLAAYIQKKEQAMSQVRKGVEKRTKALVMAGLFEKQKSEWTLNFSGMKNFVNSINDKYENFK